MPKYRTYDEYLIKKLLNPEYAQVFVNTAFEEYFNDNDSEALARSLDYLVKVNGGATKIAKEANLSRKNLYKIFNNEVKPKLETVYKLLRAMNYSLAVVPLGTEESKKRIS